MTRPVETLPAGIQHILLRLLPDERLGIRALQRAAGMPHDGILTKNQAVAIGKMDERDICAKLLAEKVMMLTGQRNFDHLGRAWLAHVMQVAMELEL